MIINTDNYHGALVYQGTMYKDAIAVLQKTVQNRDVNPNIKLWYFDELFSLLDWSAEPPVSLDVLYTNRAKQLREKYDYLILMFSGGSDSREILNTFLKSNIFIDEVRCVYPYRITEKIAAKVTQSDLQNEEHPLGMFFEYEFSAKPQLEILSEKSPKTKITLIDQSDIYLSEYKKDVTVTENPSIFCFTFNHIGDKNDPTVKGDWVNTSRNILTKRSLSHDTEKMKQQNIGVIIGADKPKLLINNLNEMSFFFSSFGRSQPAIMPKSSDRYLEELFFWSPDSPLIPIKQSHMILNTINNHINKKQILDYIKQKPVEFIEESFFKRIIYPSYSTKYYEKSKKYNTVPIKSVLSKIDHKAVDRYSDITSSFTTLYDKYMLNVKYARSKLYKIGKFNE